MKSEQVGFEQLLNDVVRHGVAHADATLLQRVALRLWYSDEVPDLNKVPAARRKDAGYLVDRLTRFNVLSKDRKSEVLFALAPFKPTQPKPCTLKDPLAVAWGVKSDLTGRLSELMPYQTRQYASEHVSAP